MTCLCSTPALVVSCIWVHQGTSLMVFNSHPSWKMWDPCVLHVFIFTATDKKATFVLFAFIYCMCMTLQNPGGCVELWLWTRHTSLFYSLLKSEVLVVQVVSEACCLCVCRWRTSLWPSQMVVSLVTLFPTTTPASCQRALSVTAPHRLLSVHRGAAWSLTAQPVTLNTPLTPSQQDWVVLGSCVSSVQLSLYNNRMFMCLFVQHTDICSALVRAKHGLW